MDNLLYGLLTMAIPAAIIIAAVGVWVFVVHLCTAAPDVMGDGGRRLD